MMAACKHVEMWMVLPYLLKITSSLKCLTKRSAVSSPIPGTPFKSWSFPTKREIAIKCFLVSPRPASISDI